MTEKVVAENDCGVYGEPRKYKVAWHWVDTNDGAHVADALRLEKGLIVIQIKGSTHLPCAWWQHQSGYHCGGTRWSQICNFLCCLTGAPHALARENPDKGIDQCVLSCDKLLKVLRRNHAVPASLHQNAFALTQRLGVLLVLRWIFRTILFRLAHIKFFDAARVFSRRFEVAGG